MTITNNEPFNDTYQGTVDAAGSLELTFGPPINQKWDVQQVSWEMTNAPSGATLTLRYGPSLVSPGYSARRGSIAGQPSLFLRGGETASMQWENCTTGDIGQVFIIYMKHGY